MEGPDRLTVVPRRFAATFPGETCRPSERLHLGDAVWAIASLGGAAIDPGIAQREAFMTFDVTGGTFAASVGCNQMRGGLSQSGPELSFPPPVASTMMACPDPLAMLEGRLAEALGTTAAYEIGGRTLRLRDAGGDIVAVLRAVYLP